MATHLIVLPANILNLSTAAAETSTTDPAVPLLRLPHSRNNLPSLFIPYTNGGSTRLHEVQTIEPDAPRSWFFNEGNIVADGRMLLVTPIDALFVLIPILRAAFPSSSDARFRTIDDILEVAAANFAAESPAADDDNTVHYDSPARPPNSKGKGKDDRPLLISDIMALGEMDCIKLALAKMCECKDIAEDLTVYRYAPASLLNALRTKVDRLASPGIFGTFRTLTKGLARDGLAPDPLLDPAKIDEAEGLRHAARLKASCDTIGQYLPPDILTLLLESYDFTTLTAHLVALAAAEAAACPAPTDSKGKVKKETAAETKKRKAGTQGSRGVETLKKANTKGMSKMSSFFTKKEK